MNFNQGMRRLAIFAGVLGAVAGGFYAHKYLRYVPSERYQHKVFEKLAASDIVKQKHAQRLLEAAKGTPFFEDSSSDVDDQPMAQTVTFDISDAKPIPDTSQPKGKSITFDLSAAKPVTATPETAPTVKQAKPVSFHNAITSPEPEIKGLPPGAIVEPLNGSTTKPPPMTLPKDFNGWDKPTANNGIKTIYWKPDFSVDSFEMQDGGYVSSGPSPSAWSYLLWVAFPMLGFFILWGAIRGIAWVGAGFFQTPR